MTILELLRSDKEVLTAADIAPILKCDQYSIVLQAKEDVKNGKNSLGFPVIVIRSRVKIPRRKFIEFMGLIRSNDNEQV